MIDRKMMATYLNAAEPGASEAAYERLGEDLEELKVERSADVQKKKNILGRTKVYVSGYEKSASVSPFYAEDGSALFTRLEKIIDGDLTGDALKTDVVDVKLWKEAVAGGFPAIREEAVLEVSGYGGDTTGYQIEFTYHLTGVKTAGTFNPTTKAFTPTAP